MPGLQFARVDIMLPEWSSSELVIFIIIDIAFGEL